MGSLADCGLCLQLIGLEAGPHGHLQRFMLVLVGWTRECAQRMAGRRRPARARVHMMYKGVLWLSVVLVVVFGVVVTWRICANDGSVSKEVIAGGGEAVPRRLYAIVKARVQAGWNDQGLWEMVAGVCAMAQGQDSPLKLR